jgi:hypothetical protein
MKKLLLLLMIATGPLAAHVDLNVVVNQAQEKVCIVLKQMHASYNWLDTMYAARERYYLSGISLDYIRQLKQKCVENQTSYTLVEKLEAFVEKLHVLDLNQKEFERIQCAAQNFLRPMVVSSKTIIT